MLEHPHDDAVKRTGHEEPLPATSPLGDLPNCAVMPRSSGESDTTARRTTDLFLARLRRYLDDDPLRNNMSTAR